MVIEIGKKNSSRIFQMATDCEERGDFDTAIMLYEQVTKMDHSHTAGRIALGNLYYQKMGYRLLAKNLYQEVIRIDPGHVLAYFNLANLLSDEEKTEPRAIFYYKKALRIDPNHVDSHFNLGEILNRRGELMEAAKHWLRYLELDPFGLWHDTVKGYLDRVRFKLLKKGDLSDRQVLDLSRAGDDEDPPRLFILGRRKQVQNQKKTD